MDEIKSLSQQWKEKKGELNDFFTPSGLVIKLKKEIEKKITVHEIADYAGGGGALLDQFNCKKIYNELLPEYFNLTPKYDIKTNEDFLSDFPFEKSQVVFLNPPFENKQNKGVEMCIKGYDLAKEFYCLIYTPSIFYVERQEKYRNYLLKDKHLFRVEIIPSKTFAETAISVVVFFFDKREVFQDVEFVKGNYSEIRNIEREDFWSELRETEEKKDEPSIVDINAILLKSNKKNIEHWINSYELRIKYFGDLSDEELSFFKELRNIKL